jgi:hypothetical protein
MEIREMEINEATFEYTGRDRFNQRLGTVTVRPYNRHSRRYQNVDEIGFRQWVQSNYRDDYIPAAMLGFLAWKRDL